MNKVESFWEDSIYKLEQAINEFAKYHEIINVSVVARETRMGTSGYNALVLYKA